MKRLLILTLLLVSLLRGYSQPLDVRPQFGHDALWGDVSQDGRHAVTAGRSSVILWDLKTGNALKEIPCRCMGAQFIQGFPYYCVAVDLLRDNGDLDSFRGVRTVVNFLTGETMFEILYGAIGKGYNTPFEFSVPYDPQGRFEVVDKVGDSHFLTGGRLPGGLSNIDISSDGRFLLVAGKHPVIWDLDKMHVLREIPLYELFMANPEILDAGLDIMPVLSSTLKKGAPKSSILTGYRQFFKARFINNDNILAGAPGGDLYVFSLDGTVLKRYRTGSRLVYDAHLAGERILAGTSNNLVFTGGVSADSLSRYDVEEPDRRYYRIIYEILPLPDRDSFLGSSDAGILYLGSLSRPDRKMEVIDLPRTDLSALCLARIDDGHVLVTSGGVCYSFNLDTRSFETLEPRIPGDIQVCCVLSDGRILCGSDRGRMSVMGRGEKMASRVLTLGSGYLRGIVEDPGRNKVYVSSSDGAIRILDRGSLDLIATCYNLGDLNSIIFTPDGYYSADKNVTNMIMYGNGLELYSFDRFDLQRNRPDIIRERLGAPREEVTLLNGAYRKRLRMMGFEESQLDASAHLPEIAITHFPASERVAVGDVTMRVQCSDRTQPVRKILAWINGTPVLGRNGLSVDDRVLTRDIHIRLAAGENRIEVSCLNASGIESVRISRTLFYDAPSKTRNLYIVAMGVSSYRENAHDLQYAAKDARDVAEMLREYGKGLYDNVFTLQLTDGEVTPEAPSLIRTFLDGATRDDSVIAFYAGHGLVSPAYDYYLSTYATEFSSPETSSIDFTSFESVFDEVLPLNKLLLVDACHSGEIDKEEVHRTLSSATARGQVTFRGTALGEESMESKILRARFNDVRRGTGATILAASNGLEAAVESDRWQNGLFTWTLREGLQTMAADRNGDGQVTVSEMIRHSEDEVARLSGGSQSPSVRSLNAECDFVIRKLAPAGRKD